MLTGKQQAEYLEDSGYCPYCGNGDIVGGHVSIEGNTAIQNVYCGNCERDWDDVYALVAITENSHG